MFKNLLLVSAGGMLGSALRYVFYVLMKPSVFPYATLTVNIAGSFIIGLIAGLSLRDPGIGNNWRLFLATGICGGFTTFSALSLESIQLIQEHRYGMAAGYIGISIVLGLAATFAGILISR